MFNEDAYSFDEDHDCYGDGDDVMLVMVMLQPSSEARALFPQREFHFVAWNVCFRSSCCL